MYILVNVSKIIIYREVKGIQEKFYTNYLQNLRISGRYFT